MQDVTNDPQYAAIRCLGIQRGTRFIIRLFSTLAMPDTLDPLLEVSREDIREILVPEDLVASSPESKELDEATGKLSSRTRKSYEQYQHIRDVFSEEFRGAPAAISMRLFGRTDDDYFEIPWFTDQLSLSLRLPQTPEEFKKYLLHEKRRSIDTQTVLGSCRDVARLNRESENRYLYGYIVNSFVIYAYKLIELESSTTDKFFDEALPHMTRLKDGARPGVGVHEDPRQIALSFDTALWHFNLDRGHRTDFLHGLHAIEDSEPV